MRGLIEKGEKPNPKLLPCAELGIFVGYPERSLGWRIYLPHRGKILTRRHVLFDERPLSFVPPDSRLSDGVEDNPLARLSVKKGEHLDELFDEDFEEMGVVVPAIDSEGFIGREVSKIFGDHGRFVGDIRSVDIDSRTGEMIYNVRYQDGDSEDLTLDEVKRYLVPVDDSVDQDDQMPPNFDLVQNVLPPDPQDPVAEQKEREEAAGQQQEERGARAQRLTLASKSG